MFRRFCKSIFLMGILVIYSIGSRGSVCADMFISYPGTRARAMGGTFIAVADDSSAVWYNPAGIAIPGNDITFEYSQAVSATYKTTDSNTWSNIWTGIQNQVEYSNDETSYFISLKFGRSLEKPRGWGLGLFSYKPYNMTYNVNYTTTNGTHVVGSVKEELYISGLVFSYDWGKFKFGFTGEVTDVDCSDSNLYSDYYGYYDKYDTRKITETHYFTSSLGVLWEVFKGEGGFKLMSGCVYRHENVGSQEDFVFDKPRSYGIGLSTEIPFTWGALILSTQWGGTDYRSISDYELFDVKYDNISAGGELRIPLKSLKAISLRTGWNNSSSNAKPDSHWADVSAVAGGIGLQLARVLFFESTYEWRRIEKTPFNEDSDVSLISASLSFSW